MLSSTRTPGSTREVSTDALVARTIKIQRPGTVLAIQKQNLYQ